MNDATTPPTAQPLRGLRVLDGADEWGELAGRLLADLGADVVRVELPEGSGSRSMPPYADDGTSLWFAYRNANKRSITIGGEPDGGRGEFAQLAADADVFIHSHHFSQEQQGAISEAHPHLIVCGITPFGQHGPYADMAATDDVLFAMSGHLALSGIPAKPPLLMPGTLASDVAGIVGAYAVLCALYQQNAAGQDWSHQGQHLDVSTYEALIQLNTWGLPNSSIIVNQGGDGVQQNLRNGTGPMYPNFATSDGFVRVVILSRSQWEALFEWMGSPEAFADPSWGDIITRLMNTDVLNPFIAEHFASMNMEEASAEAQRRGVVATPMLKPADVLVNEHFVSRGTFVDAEICGDRPAAMVSGAFTIDRERVGYRTPPPAVGNTPTDAIGWSARSAADITLEGQPLAGLRVLDFGHGGVGVEGGRMLAEYGADVIKIETRTYPDFIRLVTGGEMTPSFASSSRSKRSFGVDAKHPEGKAVLMKLIETADIVIENNSTGTMEALGLGYDDLRAVKPDITLASSQLMGSFGAYGDWIGYGPTTQPTGGLNWLWSFPDGDPPPGSNAIHPDHMAGRFCALAGMAGVLGRHNSGGQGGHYEIAQVEALVYSIGEYFLQESLSPGSTRPMGNDSDRGAPWGVYRCAGEGEQWCVISVRHDDDWAGLKRAMGSPPWADDESYAGSAGRIAAREALNEQVGEWTAGLAPLQVEAACQAHGVPCGAMRTNVDLLTDEHLRHRGFAVEIDQQDLGRITLEGAAFRGSAMDEPVIYQAPLLGEHTRSICIDELDMDPDEVDRLITAGALEVPRPE